jgi:hypothetical protein
MATARREGPLLKDVGMLIMVAMKTRSINDITDLLNCVQGEVTLRGPAYIKGWPFHLAKGIKLTFLNFHTIIVFLSMDF